MKTDKTDITGMTEEEITDQLILSIIKPKIEEELNNIEQNFKKINEDLKLNGDCVLIASSKKEQIIFRGSRTKCMDMWLNEFQSNNIYTVKEIDSIDLITNKLIFGKTIIE